MVVQSLVERLRPLVGIKSWDYIVMWKLSDDHRCIEWMDCCCGGTQISTENGEENFINFQNCCASSTINPCRDIIFSHPRIKSCELLDQLPTSIILDSGMILHARVHSQALLSNQAGWLNFSHNSDLTLSDDTIGTRVLIPLPLGLLELFVTRQVPEDQQVIDFIRAQCNIFLDPSNKNMDFSTNAGNGNTNNGIRLEGTTYDESNLFASSQNNVMSNLSSVSRWMEPSGVVEDHMNDESYMCENKGSDESDQNEDEDDAKYRRRNGKGPQSKNLVAERKRRKKLNDRLYSLRALVPNISKLDRASILGDAIDFVKDLQKQVKDLQIELEENNSDDEDGIISTTRTRNNVQNKIPPKSIIMQNGTKENMSEQNHELDNANEKVQQMEPQVEVFGLEGNEFLVKVFCEYKSGGFVRLLEALNSLGLEVTDVSTTRHTCLVSCIFKVERKNEDIVQADHVRKSLLELTRDPSSVWTNNVADYQSDNVNNNIESDNNNNDCHIHHHNNGQHSQFLSHEMNYHHHH